MKFVRLEALVYGINIEMLRALQVHDLMHWYFLSFLASLIGTMLYVFSADPSRGSLIMGGATIR